MTDYQIAELVDRAYAIHTIIITFMEQFYSHVLQTFLISMS